MSSTAFRLGISPVGVKRRGRYPSTARSCWRARTDGNRVVNSVSVLAPPDNGIEILYLTPGSQYPVGLNTNLLGAIWDHLPGVGGEIEGRAPGPGGRL